MSYLQPQEAHSICRMYHLVSRCEVVEAARRYDLGSDLVALDLAGHLDGTQAGRGGSPECTVRGYAAGQDGVEPRVVGKAHPPAGYGQRIDRPRRRRSAVARNHLDQRQCTGVIAIET